MHRHSCAQSTSPLPFAPVSRQLSLPPPLSPVIMACHGVLRPNARGVIGPRRLHRQFICWDGKRNGGPSNCAETRSGERCSTVPRCTNLCESKEWERGAGVSLQSL